MMYLSGIGDCCGADIFEGFNGRVTERNLDDAEDNERQYNYDYDNGPRHKGKTFGKLHTAILTEAQKKLNHRMMKRAGFRIVEKWRNENSGNLLYLYIRTTAEHKYKI